MRRQNIIRFALPIGQFSSVRSSRIPQGLLQVPGRKQGRVLQGVYKRVAEAGCENFTEICKILSTVIIQFVYCGMHALSMGWTDECIKL